jgi:hypothetical protein
LDADARAGEVPKKEVRRIAAWLKGIPLTVIGRGAGDEFVTAGGVDLADVDPRTMESKVSPGLFFAGEILDIDGFTGALIQAIEMPRDERRARMRAMRRVVAGRTTQHSERSDAGRAGEQRAEASPGRHPGGRWGLGGMALAWTPWARRKARAFPFPEHRHGPHRNHYQPASGSP